MVMRRCRKSVFPGSGSIWECWTLRSVDALCSVLNVTEQPITAHVPRVIGIDLGKRFSRDSVGGFTGFGALTGSAVRNERLSVYFSQLRKRYRTARADQIWSSRVLSQNALRI